MIEGCDNNFIAFSLSVTMLSVNPPAPLANFDQDILTELLRDKRSPVTCFIIFNQLIQFIQKLELLPTTLIPEVGYLNRHKYSDYYLYFFDIFNYLFLQS
jgi:hypothetical protein